MATKEELKELFSDGKKPTGADFAELIDGVKGDKGEKGEKGDTGAKGDKGDPGADGKNGADGFGTEEQYNDIITRLETLEEAITETEE